MTAPLIVAHDCFLTQAGVKFDVRIGEQLRARPLFIRHSGCNYAVGSRHMAFLRRRCATLIDLDHGVELNVRNLRSGCGNSFIPGGLLTSPCYSFGCVCNYPLQTAFALYHLPVAGQWSATEPIVMRVKEVNRWTAFALATAASQLLLLIPRAVAAR